MGKHSSCCVDLFCCSWLDDSSCPVIWPLPPPPTPTPRQILVLLCQEGVRRRELAVDSATLFTFWLLIIVCQIFPLQSLIRKALTVWDHFSRTISSLDASSHSNWLKNLPHLRPSGSDCWYPSILPFLHHLWAGGDRSLPLCCGWCPAKCKGESQKGTWTQIYFILLLM